MSQEIAEGIVQQYGEYTGLVFKQYNVEKGKIVRLTNQDKKLLVRKI